MHAQESVGWTSVQAVDETRDYRHRLISDGDELSPEELELDRRGEEEIARGDYVTLQELRRSLGR